MVSRQLLASTKHCNIGFSTYYNFVAIFFLLTFDFLGFNLRTNRLSILHAAKTVGAREINGEAFPLVGIPRSRSYYLVKMTVLPGVVSRR